MAETLTPPQTPDELADHALDAVRIDEVDSADPASTDMLDQRADDIVHQLEGNKELEDALVARAHQLVAAEANGGLNDEQQRQLRALFKLQERARLAEEKKKADNGAHSHDSGHDDDSAKGRSGGQGTAEAQARRRQRQRARAARHAGGAATGSTATHPGTSASSGRPHTPPSGGASTPPPTSHTHNTSGNPGKTARSPERHNRGGEMIPKEVEEWVKVKQELSLLKTPSAERLLAVYNAARRSAKWDDDAQKWRHVKSFTWVLDASGKWTGKEELEDFNPPRPNGKVWTEKDINNLIGEVMQLSEPREQIIRDPNVRKRSEEIMWAKFLSPAHTDRTREDGKRDMFQQAVARAQAQGLAGDEAIARANRDLYDVAYRAIKDRERAAGKSDSDAEATARKETPKDFSYEGPVGEGLLEWETDIPVEGLRRTDFAKVQATVEAALHNTRSLDRYADAYGTLSDLLSMSRPGDMKAILAKIVGGHTDADERALAALVDAAQISVHGRRANKIKEQAKEFLPELMKQFNKSREGIWRDNASYETREYIFAQYEALTDKKVYRSWDPKSTAWDPGTGKVDFSKARITNYHPAQMDEALATVKLQVMAEANLHDDLIALHNTQQRKGFIWMNPALAALNTAGVRQFGVRTGGHFQEPILGSQLEQMHNSGLAPNRRGYHNDFLNYLNLLAEDVSRRALEDWTTQEGWWFYVTHGPGAGDAKTDTARQQRERNAQEEMRKAAEARRGAYDDIWQSQSISVMMPQWYLGRRTAPRSRSGHP